MDFLNKKTICLALDFSKKDKILSMINLFADKIKIFKLHCDIIDDFDDTFIETLIKLKTKHNFLLWEDRKFADIGYITEKQIRNGYHKIIKWADIVSFHSISGYDSIPKIDNLIIFLVIELSSANNLCDKEYISRSVDIANKHPNIKGIVAQHRPDNLNKNIAVITPGISLEKTTDNINQKYDKIENKVCSNIFVIGRAITNSKEPLKAYSLLNHSL